MLKQLLKSDERKLRRWLVPHDPELALHRQLSDYFLAETEQFGTVAHLGTDDSILAVAFWSLDKHSNRAYIHHMIGDISNLELFAGWLKLSSPAIKCQVFLKSHQMAALHTTDQISRWSISLSVTPGYIVDHPAYEGVFSRVAPRFSGCVLEEN